MFFPPSGGTPPTAVECFNVFMRLSWSHKLFLRINEQVGKRRWLDLFMIFCARWLIYLLIGAVAGWGVYSISGDTRSLFFVTLTATLAAAYSVSLAVGLIIPHRRPVKELPGVKTLVPTLGTWKSFPSDHTLWSFVLVFAVLLFGARLWPALLFLAAASIVALGRVYVGVHYPRDVVGGLALALLFSAGSYFALSYF